VGFLSRWHRQAQSLARKGLCNAVLLGAGVVASFTVAGCTWLREIKRSELSTYLEPVDGPTARVRLIGSRPKVYPNSDCVSVQVPGSGYPGGWRPWGLEPRSLEMPRFADTPQDAIEVIVRADVPATISFQYASSATTPGAAGTGMPSTTRSAHCTVARAFVPAAGVDYEVRATWIGNRECIVEVTELLATRPHGHVLRIPNVSMPAFGCAGESRAQPHVPADLH
jgi:hypothetical protein